MGGRKLALAMTLRADPTLPYPARLRDAGSGQLLMHEFGPQSWLSDLTVERFKSKKGVYDEKSRSEIKIRLRRGDREQAFMLVFLRVNPTPGSAIIRL